MRILASGAVAGTPIDTLTEAELAFLDRAADHDGAAAISGGLLGIATGEDTSHDAQTASSVWRVYDDTGGSTDAGELIGFGIRARQGERHAAEFVIAPEHRERGYGEALLETILTEQPDAWCWSHGDSPAARRLAEKHGLSRDRVLYQMRTDEGLTPSDLPAATPPDGVRLRSFAPGDEEGWLRVNNAAFDWHPEQGEQSLDDIAAIVGAADFDPDTVILAVRADDTAAPTSGTAQSPDAAAPTPSTAQAPDDAAPQPRTETIIGFHQTKLTDTAGGRLGEVYVVGVDPAIHAKGVGRALTIEGMRRMVSAGASAIELYVESDNAAALGLYERLGFHVAVAHVSYAPASSPQSTQE